ncbi:ATP-binding cassette domain-containing protein [Actinomadura atramentaria]|uniref:ATP-binding cassette domain-containing protein n=1 Tax=Actinomadura atramentaria TaxID=1990 RepID=UPI000379FE55|nr:ABC transporter ATP-binding protein [Actinomadura atramentaria]
MRLDDVAFRYRRRGPWVLRGVTLDVPSGRIIEVTGGNGSGKSTLLRVLAGLRRPRRGSVTGRPARVGYAPERFPVAQPFTVRSYLAHAAALRRVPKHVVTDWAERLEYTRLLDVRLPDLSKGSAQKIGLTQAFLGDPGLLILDEPFAGLDARTRDALPALLTEHAERGATVIVSDHQRVLDHLPALPRLRVANATVTPLAALDASLAALGANPDAHPPKTSEDADPRETADRRGTAVPRETADPRETNDDASSDTAAVTAPGARKPNEQRARPADPTRPDASAKQEEQTILEVTVATREADALETRLRADGHRVRRLP